MVIFPFLIKYKETSNNTLQVPLMMAFSLGKRCANEGTTSGAGIMRLFNIKTTANTNMDTAATNRNINLSVMLF